MGVGDDGPVARRYAALIASGAIRSDSHQADLARRLDLLNRQLGEAGALRRQGLIARLFGSGRGVRGLYIHGDVGRGKTMLMDALHAEAPVAGKRRDHFNEFIGDVHDRIHAMRRRGAEGEAIAAVASAIAAEARLLCLDEFAVTDIADAMILSRLFAKLFASGVTLVATSNAAPEELYRDGLNRSLFLPFLDLLRAHCDVAALRGGTDYRLEKLTAGDVYVAPLGLPARDALDRAFRRLTGRVQGDGAVLRIKGRDVHVPEAANGVARFSFADLCEAPLGAVDYLAIARAFHTVMVDGIPILRNEQRDVARRLILLVDALYDHRVNLIASAATEPAGLYDRATGEMALAFKRTASRLIEMRSPQYLGAAHRAGEAGGPALAPDDQSG